MVVAKCPGYYEHLFGHDKCHLLLEWQGFGRLKLVHLIVSMCICVSVFVTIIKIALWCHHHTIGDFTEKNLVVVHVTVFKIWKHASLSLFKSVTCFIDALRKPKHFYKKSWVLKRQKSLIKKWSHIFNRVQSRDSCPGQTSTFGVKREKDWNKNASHKRDFNDWKQIVEGESISFTQKCLIRALKYMSMRNSSGGFGWD